MIAVKASNQGKLEGSAYRLPALGTCKILLGIDRVAGYKVETKAGMYEGCSFAWTVGFVVRSFGGRRFDYYS